MHSFCRNCLFLIVISALNGGCTSNVSAPKLSYSTPIEDTAKSINDTSSKNASKNNEAAIDLEQEALIEKQCLDAWRKCIAGNSKTGIAELKKLSKQYPRSSSVLFMTGQVLERFGDKKEAIAYYDKAANNSDFAAMSLFKIAESLRASGNNEEAIIRYRKLINIAPQFAEAHLGLAKALIKLHPASAEGKEELKTALELEPSNKEAKTRLDSYNVKK